jgi:hypothetical protein
VSDEQARLARFFQVINKHRKALPHRRPHSEQVFEALLADDGLTKDQAALLNELKQFQGRSLFAECSVQIAREASLRTADSQATPQTKAPPRSCLVRRW